MEYSEEIQTEAGRALQDILEGRMEDMIDDSLKDMDLHGMPDRRNGAYPRNFLSALGNLELCVPRTRRVSACAVLQKYARRALHIDQVILSAFVLGLSTRKVGQTLLALLGEKISASTVSQVAKTLDRSVACFHNRPLADICEVLLLDGVVLSRKTGAGAEKRPVLVALGIRKDGRKEIIGGTTVCVWEGAGTALCSAQDQKSAKQVQKGRLAVHEARSTSYIRSNNRSESPSCSQAIRRSLGAILSSNCKKPPTKPRCAFGVFHIQGCVVEKSNPFDECDRKVGLFISSAPSPPHARSRNKKMEVDNILDGE
jgi:hypothetical protein